MSRVIAKSHGLRPSEVDAWEYNDFLDAWALEIKEPSDGQAQASYIGEVIATLINLQRDPKSNTEPIKADQIFRSVSRDLPFVYMTDAEQNKHIDIQNDAAAAALQSIFDSQ
jgi:hypothetical protein